jgi:hypothetical protein
MPPVRKPVRFPVKSTPASNYVNDSVNSTGLPSVIPVRIKSSLISTLKKKSNYNKMGIATLQVSTI